MNSILLSPHSDDESLFASIIIQRYKPLVLVVTDSYNQFHSHGITAHERRAESIAAAKIHGVDLEFLGIADHRLNDYRHAVPGIVKGIATAQIIFAPAMQGGHKDHDMVSWIASSMFGVKIIFYSTYGNPLYVRGYQELKPTKAEYDTKVDALRCYPSQYAIMPYFNQVTQNPEERISELP